MTRELLIAWTMAAAQLFPGEASRGAIQQRIPWLSSTAQAVSAAILSLLE